MLFYHRADLYRKSKQIPKTISLHDQEVIDYIMSSGKIFGEISICVVYSSACWHPTEAPLAKNRGKAELVPRWTLCRVETNGAKFCDIMTQRSVYLWGGLCVVALEPLTSWSSRIKMNDNKSIWLYNIKSEYNNKRTIYLRIKTKQKYTFKQLPSNKVPSNYLKEMRKFITVMS